MLTWSGIRGAVGLAMAIVADEADYTSAAAGRQIVFFAGGVAFLTVLVNGSSTHLLMRALGMLKPTEAEAILHGYVDATVERRTVEAEKGETSNEPRCKAPGGRRECGRPTQANGGRRER